MSPSPLKLSAAVRAGEELVPSPCRNQYFLLTADRGAMLACLMGMAHLGGYPKGEAKQEAERLKSLMTFGDGKIHTAAHAITKRLYAAFPDLGKNVLLFPRLLRAAPAKPPRDRLVKMTLFGFLTHLFDELNLPVEDCVTALEAAGM